MSEQPCIERPEHANFVLTCCKKSGIYFQLRSGVPVLWRLNDKSVCYFAYLFRKFQFCGRRIIVFCKRVFVSKKKKSKARIKRIYFARCVYLLARLVQILCA